MVVKAYLRYVRDGSFGIICSNECNVCLVGSSKALTAAAESVLLWNVRQGTVLRTMATESTKTVSVIATKPNDDSVCSSGYSDGTIRLWNYNDGNCTLTLSGHKSAVSAMCFAKSGHLMASGSNDTDIVLWDLVAEAGICRFRGHRDRVTDLVFLYDKDGEPSLLVSASKDHFIKIWNIKTQMCIQTIVEHRSEVWSLAVNAAQTRLVAGSTDHQLRVWNINPDASAVEEGDSAIYAGSYGVLQRTGKDNVGDLRFVKVKDPEGDEEVLVVQGTQSKTVEFFRAHSAGEIKRRMKRRQKRANEKRKKKGEEVEKEETTQQLVDEFFHLPSYTAKAKIQSIGYHPSSASMLVGLHNNSMDLVKIKSDALVKLEDEAPKEVAEAKFKLEHPGHRSAVRSLAVSPDDSLIMSTSAEGVKIWNAQSKKCIKTIASGYGLCGFFVPGNQHIIVGTKTGCIELIDLASSTVISSQKFHEGAIYGLTENPKRTGFVSCAADKTVKEFTFFTEVKTITEGGTSVEQSTVAFKESDKEELSLNDDCLAVCFSPDGKYLAVSLLDYTVQIFYADTMKFFMSLYGHKLPVLTLDYSSDGELLATGSADKNIKLWSTKFGSCFKSLRAHDDSVMQVKFMHGTHYLVSVSRDRTVRTWDCDKFEMIGCLTGHTAEVWALGLSKDAAFIVTAGNDRGIRVWSRTDEMMFLSEEREKELDEQMDQDAAREDVKGHLAANEVVAARPTRRTIETVRSTERLMEVLDEANTEIMVLKKHKVAVETAKAKGETVPVAPTPNLVLFGRSPQEHVLRYISFLTANTIYEVLLALPYNYAIMLLEFLASYFEAAHACRHDKSDDGVAVSFDMSVRAVLILVQVHFKQMGSSPQVRPLLTQLKEMMRTLLSGENQRLGYNVAALTFLQREMKRNRVVLDDLPGKKVRVD